MTNIDSLVTTIDHPFYWFDQVLIIENKFRGIYDRIDFNHIFLLRDYHNSFTKNNCQINISDILNLTFDDYIRLERRD